MEQREFDATQRIHEVCYQLVKAGYSMRDVHTAMANVMNAMGFKYPERLSTEPLSLSINIDTAHLNQKLKQSARLAKDLRDVLDD